MKETDHVEGTFFFMPPRVLLNLLEEIYFLKVEKESQKIDLHPKNMGFFLRKITLVKKINEKGVLYNDQ